MLLTFFTLLVLPFERFKYFGSLEGFTQLVSTKAVCTKAPATLDMKKKKSHVDFVQT